MGIPFTFPAPSGSRKEYKATELEKSSHPINILLYLPRRR